jgi:hypothetical protein
MRSAYLPILDEAISETVYRLATALDEGNNDQARTAGGILQAFVRSSSTETYAKKSTREIIRESLDAYGIPLIALDLMDVEREQQEGGATC